MKPSAETPFTIKLGLHTRLDDSDRAALTTLVTRPLPLRAGETLTRAGDPLDVTTIVLEGMLCRTKQFPDGRRQILSLLLPGDLVDAQAAVLRRRDDDLEAVGGASVSVVPQSRLTDLAAKHPALREAFLREALIEAAIAREWVRNLGRRNAKEALAHLLCELHCRFDSVGLVNGGKFPFPLKQEQMADALGLSTIHLNRVYRELRNQGLLSQDGRWVTVPQVGALRRVAHFQPSYLHLDGDELASPAV